jgi:hypothetical protein
MVRLNSELMTYCLDEAAVEVDPYAAADKTCNETSQQSSNLEIDRGENRALKIQT